jgi:hypothetical protein
MAIHNDTTGFRINALYRRVKALTGGSDVQIERWWSTPLPYAPFNLRAPQDLMNDTEWTLVRNWLTENIRGGWDDDVDLYNQSQMAGTVEKLTGLSKDTETLMRASKIRATGGNSIYDIFPHVPNTAKLPVAYKVHIFTSSGLFVVEKDGTLEYLIVGAGGGGGGGSGNGASGGGGGGGVLSGFVTVKHNRFNITVGVGGTSGDDSVARNSANGGNSNAFGITAYGGGAGASYSANILHTGVALGGASGGGGAGSSLSAGALALYNLDQGYNGGAGYNSGGYSLGGGGGGAGGLGSDATLIQAGRGGAGKPSAITTTNPLFPVYYGGGGGGGAYNGDGGATGGSGGTGGGATGQSSVSTGTSSNATANTGGGGAGAGFGTRSGSAGGSGIVVIRYPIW